MIPKAPIRALSYTLLLLHLSLFAGCSSLLYQPLSLQAYDPAQKELSYEEVEIEGLDGSKLMGWYFPPKPYLQNTKPKGYVVFFHGNGENISTHFAALDWLPEHGYAYFIFDYQGYWRSEGSPSPENTVHDGVKAIEWMNKRRKTENSAAPLFVFAQSLGGTVAMRSVIEMSDHRSDIAGLVLESSFLSYQEMAQSVLSRSFITWPFQWLPYLVLSDRWAPGERVSEISPVPILVIHGTADSIVEFEHGEEIYKSARDPKQFWKVDNGQHINTFWINENVHRKKLLEFFKWSESQRTKQKQSG